MKDGRRRNRRCKETRAAELLGAAREVFVEKGFAAARLDDVAAKAGVSKGTAYLYFASKEALFRAVVESGLAHVVEVMEELDSLGNETDRPALDLLRRYFDAWKRLAGEAAIGSALKLLAAESGNFPDVATRFDNAIVRVARRALVRIVETGIASGDFRPVEPGVIADIFLGAIWQSEMGALSGLQTSPDRLIAAIFDILALGLLQHAA